MKVRDVVEIYHPDVVGSRVLLQVHSLKEEMQTKGRPIMLVIFNEYYV